MMRRVYSRHSRYTQAANIQVYGADNGDIKVPTRTRQSCQPGAGRGFASGMVGTRNLDGSHLNSAGRTNPASNATGALWPGYDGAHAALKLHLLNSAHPNTVQIKLPFGQFDATPVAQAGCTPQCRRVLLGLRPAAHALVESVPHCAAESRARKEWGIVRTAYSCTTPSTHHFGLLLGCSYAGGYAIVIWIPKLYLNTIRP